MADKEFTQICKEILGVSKRIEKIEPDELRKIKADIEQISATVAAHKASFDASKEDFDGKYSGITEIINTFDTLKSQIEQVLKSGTINDAVETSVSAFSSKKTMELLRGKADASEVKELLDKKLGATAKAADSDKLDGLDSSAFTKAEDVYLKKTADETFLKITDAIDAYSKTESDAKYALKNEVSDGLAIGSYLLWSSLERTPPGFLVCNGDTFGKSIYPELFAVIGYTYGGSGEYFQVPKFNDGRFMRSTGGSASALGVRQKGSLHYIDLKNDSLWGLGAATRIADLNAVGFDKNTDAIDPALYTNYVGRGGTYAASTLENTYPNDIQSAVVRPTNSSMVVLIKAKHVKEPSAQDIDKDIHATDIKAGIVKLKQEVTGDATDCAVSEKAIRKVINQMFGVGQTLQDVTKQRVSGTNYTNNTGRTILVIYVFSTAQQSHVGIRVDNVEVTRANATSGANEHCITVPVPNGSTYKYIGSPYPDSEKKYELR